MCEHEHFRCDIDVNRLTHGEGGSVYAFVADIKIHCVDCKIEFTFPPLPVGINCSEARVNVDGTVLRLPLKPKDQMAFNAFPRFTLRMEDVQ